MNDELQMKKELVKKWIIVGIRTGKVGTIFSLTILFLALGSLITLFMGDAYNFLNQCLVTPCIWVASVRLFVFRWEHPDSRVIRWAFRIAFLMSIVHTILLVRYL